MVPRTLQPVVGPHSSLVASPPFGWYKYILAPMFVVPFHDLDDLSFQSCKVSKSRRRLSQLARVRTLQDRHEFEMMRGQMSIDRVSVRVDYVSALIKFVWAG